MSEREARLERRVKAAEARAEAAERSVEDERSLREREGAAYEATLAAMREKGRSVVANLRGEDDVLPRCSRETLDSIDELSAILDGEGE